MHCLCTDKPGVTCDATHCDLAGPGAPGDASQCRICWLRLRRRARTLARFAPAPCIHLGGSAVHLDGSPAAPADCKGCGMKGRRVEVRRCTVHALCTTEHTADLEGVRLACCRGCPDYQAVPASVAVPGDRKSDLVLVTLNIGGVMHIHTRASLQHAARRWGADYHEATQPITAVGGRPHWQKTFLAGHLARGATVRRLSRSPPRATSGS